MYVRNNAKKRLTEFPAIYKDVDLTMIAYLRYINKLANSIKDSEILDVGCGLGNYTKLFSVNNNKVTGIDIIDFREKRLQKYFKFIKYNGKKMPFKKESFDFIVSFDVIEHVREDLSFVKEIKRVLKTGGHIFIATPNRNRLANCLYSFIGKPRKFPMLVQESGIGGKSVHEREYTGNELLDLFKKVDFKELSLDYFWFGLRGKINIGIEHFFLKKLCSYLFLTGVKK